MSRAPVLLVDDGGYGSLAALRSFGHASIPVVVAGPHRGTPVASSRFVSRWLPSPRTGDPETLRDWLLTFGREHPGHHLALTNDDMAWVVARNLPALCQHFRIFSVEDEGLRAVLDKRRLGEHCDAVGIAHPETRYPESLAELHEICRAMPRPFILKPRTQVLLNGKGKGSLVGESEAVGATIERYLTRYRYDPAVLAAWPDLGMPMVQAFHPDAAACIYSVIGFVDAAGNLSALAARKILSRPRQLGLGVCFESAPLPGEMRERVAALCLRVGYVGIFQTEFLQVDDRLLLIDFNPRYYNFMRFEILRGLDLPLLAYEAAGGADTGALIDATNGRTAAMDARRAYVHHVYFRLMLAGQRLSGRMSSVDVRRWRDWYRSFPPAMRTDAVADEEDPEPARADLRRIVGNLLRHPRSQLSVLVR